MSQSESKAAADAEAEIGADPVKIPCKPPGWVMVFVVTMATLGWDDYSNCCPSSGELDTVESSKTEQMPLSAFIKKYAAWYAEESPSAAGGDCICAFYWAPGTTPFDSEFTHCFGAEDLLTLVMMKHVWIEGWVDMDEMKKLAEQAKDAEKGS